MVNLPLLPHLYSSNPLINHGLEHAEWHRTASEHGIMEAADIELIAQSLLSFFAAFSLF